MAYCEHCDHCNAEALNGKNIRARRERMGLTLTDMAIRVGITKSYLSDIEHNRRAVHMHGTGQLILAELQRLEEVQLG